MPTNGKTKNNETAEQNSKTKHNEAAERKYRNFLRETVSSMPHICCYDGCEATLKWCAMPNQDGTQACLGLSYLIKTEYGRVRSVGFYHESSFNTLTPKDVKPIYTSRYLPDIMKDLSGVPYSDDVIYIYSAS